MKRSDGWMYPDCHLVAPYAGAWIETGVFIAEPWVEEGSRPTRARGLKL